MKGELAEIAAKYAEATLKLIEESESPAGEAATMKKAEAVYGDLKAIQEALATSHDFRLILNHPALGPAEKKQLLGNIFQAKVDPVTFLLLQLLADRRRLNILEEISHEFKKLLMKRLNILEGTLVSSIKLGEKEVANIKARISEHMGSKLDLTVEVDETLLAGMMLRVGDQVIDGSLKGKLQKLEQSLLSV